MSLLRVITNGAKCFGSEIALTMINNCTRWY